MDRRSPPQLIPSLSEEACERAKVFMCKYCARPFVRQQAFKDHASTCKEKAESKSEQRTKVTMRFGSDIARDPVHKAERQLESSCWGDSAKSGSTQPSSFFPMAVADVPTISSNLCAPGMGTQERGCDAQQVYCGADYLFAQYV
jgi:hypothetical protein